MPILTLHPELLAIGLLSRENSVDAASFESFGCQPVAQNGNALQNAHAFPGKDPAVECDYPGAGSCFYDPSGALVTQSASPNCPDSLVQAQLVSQTTTESTTSTTPPSTSSSEVAGGGGLGGSTADAPPSTSSPSAGSSAPTTTSTAVTGVGPVAPAGASGVAGSATTSILSSIPASPSAPGRGALETGTTSENQPHPAVVGGAVAAAVVVIVVFLALLLLWLRRRRRRQRQFPVEESPTPHTDAVDLVPAVAAVAPRSEPSSAKGCHSYPDSFGTTAGMSEVGVGSTISAGDLDSDVASETLTQRIRRMEAQMEALLARGVADTAPPEYAV